MKPKYPKIKVQLSGHDGNAFAIIGKVRNVMRAKKVSEEEIKLFSEEAMSGDYDHLLQTCFKWVDVN